MTGAPLRRARLVRPGGSATSPPLRYFHQLVVDYARRLVELMPDLQPLAPSRREGAEAHLGNRLRRNRVRRQ